MEQKQIDKICAKFQKRFVKNNRKRIEQNKKKMRKMENIKKGAENLSVLFNNPPKSLREAVIQYVTLMLLVIANMGWTQDSLESIISFALTFAVYLFVGWIKKANELNIAEKLKEETCLKNDNLQPKEENLKLKADYDANEKMNQAMIVANDKLKAEVDKLSTRLYEFVNK